MKFNKENIKLHLFGIYVILLPGIFNIFSLNKNIEIILKVMLILFSLIVLIEENIKKKLLFLIFLLILIGCDFLRNIYYLNYYIYYFSYFFLQCYIPTILFIDLKKNIGKLVEILIKYSIQVLILLISAYALKKLSTAYMAVGVATTFPILILILNYNKQKNIKYILVPSLIIYFLKTNRSGQLIILLYLVYIFMKKINIKIKIAITFLISFIIVNLKNIVDEVYKKLLEYNIFSYSLLKYKRMLDYGFSSGLSGRDEIYENTLNIIKNNLLIGKGMPALREIGSRFDYPHNIFLQILMEFGILGIVLFLVVLIRIYKSYSKKTVEEKEFFIIVILMNIRLLFSSSYLVYPMFWIMLFF